MAQRSVISNLAKRSASEASEAGQARERTVLRWVVGVLSMAGFVALVPFWAPLVLASWGAIIAWPLQQRLAKLTRHRGLAAGLLTTGLVIAILTPVAIVTLSLAGAAVALSHNLAASNSGTEALKILSTNAGGALDLSQLNPQRAFELVRNHGARAWGAARVVIGAASVAAIGLVVFVWGFLTFLIEGRSAHDWLMERSPLSHAHFHRLANVFAEVGRGLLVGVGLTALAQGVVATIGYLVTGVPQALVLGLVTIIASLIPSVGSGLVWGPVTAGLALSGRTGAAITLLCIGLVVSVIDNLLRPVFVRYADLRLNGLVLFVAMLGGILLLGAWGLLLGPLVVRLASEGLTMLREERPIRTHQS